MQWKAKTGQKIEKLYAWLAIEQDGGEGIVAMSDPISGWMPLVGADLARMESLRPVAVVTKKQMGVPIRLVEYSTRAVLEDL